MKTKPLTLPECINKSILGSGVGDSTHDSLPTAELGFYFDTFGSDPETPDIFMMITSPHFKDTERFFDCAVDLNISQDDVSVNYEGNLACGL